MQRAGAIVVQEHLFVPFEEVAIAVEDPEAAIADKEEEVLGLEGNRVLALMARVKICMKDAEGEDCCEA